MEVRSTSLRIGALALGAVGLIATAFFFRVSPVAILCGISFGVGGWLVDYFTGFRKLGGQISSWALAAGGVIVLFSAPTVGVAHYVIPLQYVSVVLVCWGLLMFTMPVRHHEP
jgi:hypothetical protein